MNDFISRPNVLFAGAYPKNVFFRCRDSDFQLYWPELLLLYFLEDLYEQNGVNDGMRCEAKRRVIWRVDQVSLGALDLGALQTWT